MLVSPDPLVAFLESEDVYEIIFTAHECGWMDGGCRILADTLMITQKDWNPQLWAIYGTVGMSVLHHYLVEVDAGAIRPNEHLHMGSANRVFLDGEGIHSKSEMLAFWEDELKQPIQLVESDPSEDVSKFVPQDQQLSEVLINKLGQSNLFLSK